MEQIYDIRTERAAIFSPQTQKVYNTREREKESSTSQAFLANYSEPNTLIFLRPGKVIISAAVLKHIAAAIICRRRRR